jgi:hypothetical protein
MIGTCKNCSKTFKFSPSQKGGIYCSNKCQQEFQYQQNISNWLSKKITGSQKDGRPSDFVRKYLLEESCYKCSKCGWGEKNPHNGIVHLEIDHISGKRDNNYKENLQVLCPNCHSLTDTYKTLNKNIGYHKQNKKQDSNKK